MADKKQYGETLDRQYLKSLLRYSAQTGQFHWIVNRRSVKAGQRAGYKTNYGYWAINIDNKRYFAHRLAWLYTFGEWPPKSIDHANGDRLDNCFSNLRLANHSQNGCNRKKPQNNASGFKGVGWYKRNGKWRARIKYKGKEKFLGFFDCPLKASAAYEIASKELHGEFACN